jgi:hypothetical protein
MLDLALTTLQRRQIAFGSLVAGVGGFALGYVPQVIAYNALNGYPGPASHVARKMYWYAPHGLQVLLSPNHGFFFWTPLALLAIAGLIVLAMRTHADGARRIGIALLVMVVSQVYVAGSVASWTVAGAFGQRRFVCLTVVLVIGLAVLFADRIDSADDRGRLGHARPKGRAYWAAVVALCVWWNMALMFQFATGTMDRQRLEPGRNAYNAFVTVPLEAPALIYRYLTDRESFYRPPAPARTP